MEYATHASLNNMVYNKVWKDFLYIPRCVIERGTSAELSKAIFAINIAIVDHFIKTPFIVNFPLI